jgi:hypothetical protein
VGAGYLVKRKDARRNRYQIHAHLPLPEPASECGHLNWPRLGGFSPPLTRPVARGCARPLAMALATTVTTAIGDLASIAELDSLAGAIAVLQRGLLRIRHP